MATTGHESETINVGGLKSSLQALKTKYIDDLEEAIGTGGSVDTRIATAKTEIIGGATTNGNTLKKLEDRVSPLESAVGSGGSVDTRISNAINALDSSASQSAGADGLALSITETNGKITAISGSITVNTYDTYGAASAAQTAAISAAATDATNKVNEAKSEIKGNATSACDTLGEAEAKINANATNISDLYSQLIAKADKGTTLSSYGITDAYTKGAVDNMIAALSRGNIVVGSRPSTGSANTIYRVPNTNYYEDWMYYSNSWIKLATFNNGVDNYPSIQSSNLVNGGGIFNYLASSGIRLHLNENDLRYNKGINNAPPYDILNTSAGNVAITKFIKIPYNCSKILFKGFYYVDGYPLAYRLSVNDTDSDPNNCVRGEFLSDHGEIDLSIYDNYYKYFTITISRVIPWSDILNILGNVELYFDSDFYPSLYSCEIFKVNFTTGINMCGTFPEIFTSTIYKLTDFISVSAGDIIIAPNIYVGFTAFWIVGYKSNIQSSYIDNFKFLGKGISSDYFIKIPYGVNYVRICFNGENRPNSGSFTYYKINIKDFCYSKINYLVNKHKFNILKDYNFKFPTISSRKGCICFQMDGNMNLFTNLDSYLNILGQYGIFKSTFVLLSNTFNQIGNTLVALNQSEQEIVIHGLGNHDGDYETILKQYIETFWEFNIISKGYTEMSTNISPAELEIAKKYFGWIVKNGGDYDSCSDSYLDAIQNLSDSPFELKRLCLELTPSQYSSYKQKVINNVKNAIQETVEQKKLLVLYGHSYNVLDASYTVYPDILEPILQYIEELVKSNDLIVGNTSECLEYYYTKRWNE